MTNSYSQLGYGEFQASFVFVVFGALDYHPASWMLTQVWKLVLNDSWFVSLTQQKTHFAIGFNALYAYAFTYISVSRNIIMPCFCL